jgi:hypothetical protein
VQTRLGAATVVVHADGRVVAQHPRSLHKGTEDLVLDHYLEILVRKPGALAGATALIAARASGGSPTPIKRSGTPRDAPSVTGVARRSR